ncbi:MAG: beta-lactamase family protein [Planctomycetes bacterium]|nr:beta-lactamase family protein [Planctomycetota bacterium]
MTILLVALVSLGQPAPAEAVRASLAPFVASGDIAGAVAVVGDSAGVIAFEALGKRDLAAGDAMPRDALFRIASMTKPVTALTVMQLVEAGKVDLDAPVARYLPEFRDMPLVKERAGTRVVLDKPARQPTVRDLMRHTSGLPGGYPKGLEKLYERRDLPLSVSSLALAQRPLEFEPGSKWAYCNPGIDTLGRLAEVVSGTRFEDLLRDRILLPLGMKDTSFYPSAESLKRLATNYDKKNGNLVPVGTPLMGPPQGALFPVPAGGLYSTGADLARLYRAMLAGGELDGARVISAASLAEMTRLQTGDLPCGFVDGMGFGLGWARVREPKGVTAMLSPGTYGHGGAFGTQAWIDPGRGLFIVLLIQRTGLGNGDASPMREALQKAAVALPRR